MIDTQLHVTKYVDNGKVIWILLEKANVTKSINYF